MTNLTLDEARHLFTLEPERENTMTEPRRITVIEIKPDGLWQRIKDAVFTDLERGFVLAGMGETLRSKYPVRTSKRQRQITDRRRV